MVLSASASAGSWLEIDAIFQSSDLVIIAVSGWFDREQNVL